MRHKGSGNEFKEQQDREIVEAYHLIFYAYGGKVSARKLYEKVAASPSSRFFVTERQALRIVSKILNGQPLPPMRRLRRCMYEEIACRVTVLLRHHPSLKLTAAVRTVVTSPAPEMYLSVRQIIDIIKKQKRDALERRKCSLHHTF